MFDQNIKNSLTHVREWARDKIDTGSEPPWAWYQYMKLIETVDAILYGSSVVSLKEDLLQSGSHQGSSLRLVDDNDSPNIAPHRPDPPKPRMPM